MVLIILVVIFVVVLDVMQVEATMYFPVAVDELSMSSGSAIAGATKRSGLRLW